MRIVWAGKTSSGLGRLAVESDAEHALSVLSGGVRETFVVIYVCDSCGRCGAVSLRDSTDSRRFGRTDEEKVCLHRPDDGHAEWNVGLLVELFARSICGS